jgi:hypothetical protein
VQRTAGPSHNAAQAYGKQAFRTPKRHPPPPLPPVRNIYQGRAYEKCGIETGNGVAGPTPRRIREPEAGTGARRERDGPAARRAPPGRPQRARGPRPAGPGVLLHQTRAKPGKHGALQARRPTSTEADKHGTRPALADTATPQSGSATGSAA